MSTTDDNSLFLWNIQNMDSPVHCFYGHRDIVLDFEWRKLEDTADAQMVKKIGQIIVRSTNRIKYFLNRITMKYVSQITWSLDHTFRLWNVDTSIQSQCGSEPDSMEDTGRWVSKKMGITKGIP